METEYDIIRAFDLLNPFKLSIQVDLDIFENLLNEPVASYKGQPSMCHLYNNLYLDAIFFMMWLLTIIINI